MTARPPDLPVVALRDLARPQPEGLVRVPFFSARLGLRRWVAVLRPPSYAPGQVAGVAYLFRGHHSEWFNPREDPSREQPLPQQALEAMRSGRLPPLVLIVPCLGSDDRLFQTTAANWQAPHLACSVPGMGLGDFETHLREELVPQVEAALGLKNPRRVGIGFSLGGLTAFILGWRQPGLFSDLAAYDGSFFHDPLDAHDSILHHRLFEPVFGSPRESSSVRPYSPLWLVRRLPEEHLARTRYYLQSGPPAAEPGDANHDRTLSLVQALAARGLENQVSQVVEDGHHNWKTADRFAVDMLYRMFSAP